MALQSRIAATKRRRPPQSGVVPQHVIRREKMVTTSAKAPKRTEPEPSLALPAA